MGTDEGSRPASHCLLSGLHPDSVASAETEAAHRVKEASPSTCFECWKKLLAAAVEGFALADSTVPSSGPP